MLKIQFNSFDVTIFQLSFVALKDMTYPAKPNSFIALASQLRVSAWFFGFFCANAKDTTWNKIIFTIMSLCQAANRKFLNEFDGLEEKYQTCSAVHGNEQDSPMAVRASLAFPPHLTSPTLSTRPSRTTEADVLENCPLWATRATIWSFICITCICRDNDYQLHL